MEFTAGQIAAILNGKVEGDPEIKINSLSKIEEGKSGSISFLANPKYTQFIYSTEASVVVVGDDFIATQSIQPTLIRTANPANAFADLLIMYQKVKDNKKGISKQAAISDSAVLGTNVYAGEFCVVSEHARIGNNVKLYPQVYVGDNVVIGDNTTVYAGVKIYSETSIGSNCIIHSGSVIGSDGFRFEPTPDGIKKVPQTGNVVIEDDVEIGANCAIDRATLGSTIIRRGVKFDNLIHIAHNVEVGENCMLAACNVIAGSTKIGKNCMFSGQVGIVGHIQIADNTIITAQSGISKTIKKRGEIMMGSPAFEAGQYRKSYVHFRNIDSLAKRVDQLEAQQSLNTQNSVQSESDK